MTTEAKTVTKDDELSMLCQSCGMCCDGSLFDFVRLAPGEAGTARKQRLRVIRGGQAVAQPCVALSAGQHRACSVYEGRPRACGAFVCRLYERHRSEGGDLEPRLAAVQRTRALLSELASRKRTPADFDGARELVRRLEEDFARA